MVLLIANWVIMWPLLSKGYESAAILPPPSWGELHLNCLVLHRVCELVVWSNPGIRS